MNEAIGADEVVRQCRFAVVDMRQDADVPDTFLQASRVRSSYVADSIRAQPHFPIENWTVLVSVSMFWTFAATVLKDEASQSMLGDDYRLVRQGVLQHGLASV